MDEIQRLKDHVKELQEAVGRWRRMAQELAPQAHFLKERHDHQVHFVDIVVSTIPPDTPLHEAQYHIKETILPVYYPYAYHACYRSAKWGWVVTLTIPDFEVDMGYQPPGK